MLAVVLFTFTLISAVESQFEESWVEFCDPGDTGICLVKQGGGLGFRCYTASIQDTKDCDGSHWANI